MSTSKTEDPTPQRIRELRRKGTVAVSRELNKSAALVGALLAFIAVTPSVAHGLAGLFGLAATVSDPARALWLAGGLLMRSALPIAGAAAVAAVAMGVVQTGMLFSPSTVLPRSERFKLGQAWSSQLRVDSLVNAAIAAGATLVCALVAASGIRRLVSHSDHLADTALRQGASAVAGAVGDTMVSVGAAWLGVAATIALVDAVWQRHAFLRRNRMSFQEIRDQFKQSEGDPQHKARRARAHRELLQGNWRVGVERADVVVVNPTHLAIGLRYRPDEADAPIVTVSGRGDRAKAIKRLARRQGVPEYADRRCARAIIDLEVDEAVPDTLFEAVAVVFRWAQSLKESDAA